MEMIFLLEKYMEDGKVTDNTLLNIQREIAMSNGVKIDIYHSELHRGIIICEHGVPMFFGNKYAY